jgi:hypothetical protein
VPELTAKLEHADQGADNLGALAARAGGKKCQAVGDHLRGTPHKVSIQPHSRTQEHRTMERGSLCCQSAQGFLGFFLPLYKLKWEMGIAPPDAACPP